jgi:DNA polymerase delta subunit 1
MNPVKRSRLFLEDDNVDPKQQDEANDHDIMMMPSSPKRIRGGGGPSLNPYSKKLPSSGKNNAPRPVQQRPPAAPPEEEEEDEHTGQPFVDDEDFMDEIQEIPDDVESSALVTSSTVFSDITENIRQKWLRPENQVTDNSQDLSLQWLDMDLLGGKALEESPNEEKKQRGEAPPGFAKGQVPIIRAYGVTEAGNSVTVFIHGYLPYGYFSLPPGASFEDTKANCFKIMRLLDQRLEGSARGGKLDQYCLKVQYIKDKKSIMGFETTDTKFFKVTVAMPTLIPTLKRIMEEGIELPGVSTVGGNNQFSAFECNVPFVLRYMIDRDVTGAGWMTLPSKTYQVRPQNKKQTHCQVSAPKGTLQSNTKTNTHTMMPSLSSLPG